MSGEIIKAKYSHDVFIPEKKPGIDDGQIVELTIKCKESASRRFYGCLAIENQDLIEEIINSDEIE